jgi:hypothetical protein
MKEASGLCGCGRAASHVGMCGPRRREHIAAHPGSRMTAYGNASRDLQSGDLGKFEKMLRAEGFEGLALEDLRRKHKVAEFVRKNRMNCYIPEDVLATFGAEIKSNDWGL